MALETDVGISAFCTSAPGFTGVLKHRYSDFFVNEISSSGALCRLTDLTPPVEITAEPDQMAQRARLCDVLGEARVLELEALAEPAGESLAGQFQTVPLAKDQRKAVHEAVRSYFPSLDSTAAPPCPDAMPGYAGIAIFRRPTTGNKRQRDSNGGGGSSGLKFEPWPSHRPDFLAFTLHKRNTDTLAASAFWTATQPEARAVPPPPPPPQQSNPSAMLRASTLACFNTTVARTGAASLRRS